MKEKNFISVILYLFNAENTIENFLKNIDSFLSENFEDYEIIIVNNLSTDKSIEKIKKIKNSLICNNLIIQDLARKHDVELAMLAGTEFAIGDYIFEFESTMIDFPINIIRELYDEAMSGYDIVGAVPENKQKTSSKLFYRLLNKVSYLDLDLTTENFRIVSRRTLNKVLNLKEKIRYRKALYRYSGFPHKNVFYASTKNNISTEIKNKNKLNLAIDILFSFSNIGLKILMILSFVFFFISITIGIYAVIVYVFYETIIQGWTTTMLFLSFGFSGIFFSLGILGKYLSMILLQLHDRPNYIVKSIDRLDKNFLK